MPEWKMEPLPIHGWRIIDETGQEIVADVYDEKIAVQIVDDHNARESRRGELINAQP